MTVSYFSWQEANVTGSENPVPSHACHVRSTTAFSHEIHAAHVPTECRKSLAAMLSDGRLVVFFRFRSGASQAKVKAASEKVPERTMAENEQLLREKILGSIGGGPFQLLRAFRKMHRGRGTVRKHTRFPVRLSTASSRQT